MKLHEFKFNRFTQKIFAMNLQYRRNIGFALRMLTMQRRYIFLSIQLILPKICESTSDANDIMPNITFSKNILESARER